MTEQVSKSISIPVIASGGCGKLEDFSAIFEKTGADAALAASLFHYRELTVGQVKEHLRQKGFRCAGKEEEDESGFIFSKGGSDPRYCAGGVYRPGADAGLHEPGEPGKTLSTGYTWLYSRSRKTLWNKGASSGHRQKVQRMYYDCDEDTILAVVEQTGNACHTGAHSCFYRAFPDYEK